jgi:hypothetical protein
MDNVKINKEEDFILEKNTRQLPEVLDIDHKKRI